MRDKRVTIRDLAAECGLALSTVSNALAGKHHVSDETRKLVNSVAARIGYRASALARGLRMQRSFALGVLMADVANPAFPAFVRGIEDVAIRERYTLLLCNTDDDEEKQIRQMQTLIDRQIDGMVLISQHTSSPNVRRLLDSGIPFVLVQRRSPAFADDYVGSDNTNGIRVAVQHLYGLGHRRIAFIRGPVVSSTSLERFVAFETMVKEFGLDRSPDLIYQGDYSGSSGTAACEVFLALSKPPSGIIASNDLNAFGVMDAAHARGLSIPQDLSVVGFDDIALSSSRSLNLTTVHQPKREMGRAAAELLIKRIVGKRIKRPQEIIFATELVVRGSTGPTRSQMNVEIVGSPRAVQRRAKRSNLS